MFKLSTEKTELKILVPVPSGTKSKSHPIALMWGGVRVLGFKI